MNAGRELDALIAENIMHLPRLQPGATEPLEGYIEYSWGVEIRIPDEDGNYPFGSFQPSTDAADAMLVVAKMEHSGWGHKHLVHSPGAENPGCEWTFMSPGHGPHSISAAKAETAPLAICRAALKAVGVDAQV